MESQANTAQIPSFSLIWSEPVLEEEKMVLSINLYIFNGLICSLPKFKNRNPIKKMKKYGVLSKCIAFFAFKFYNNETSLVNIPSSVEM